MRRSAGYISAGRVEAQNIRALAALGIDNTPLVAYGERLHADGLLESFLLTEELEGYLELQALVRERFPAAWHVAQYGYGPVDSPGGRDRPPVPRGRLQSPRLLLLPLSRQGTFCGEFDVRLIDLQRVQHRRWFRRRWIVKDLAQLSYSAPHDRLRPRDKVAFWRYYLGVHKLRPCDKRLIREVARKQRRMRTASRPGWVAG